MKKMTSRERVHAAIEHREVDLTPAMLWLEAHTAVRIANDIRPPSKPLDNFLWRGVKNLSDAIPNDDIANAAQLAVSPFMNNYKSELGSDFIEYHWTPLPMWLRDVRFEKGRMKVTDMYGVERGIGGLYFETTNSPCPDEKSLDRYEFPDVSGPVHYAHVRLARLMHPDKFLLGWCPGMQDWGQSIHPMEKLYTGMVYYPDAIKKFFRKFRDHSIQIIRGMMAAGADGIMIGDDYGSQQRMLISKKMWTEFTFPMLKSQCDEIHRLGGKALLHSCGVVAPLLDKFVEAGLDALHPFQSLPGNNLEEAKEMFGDRLCFFTGIDVQKISVMPPNEVYDEIVNAARIASRGGGFVLAHTNFLQKDTPAESLAEMFRAIDDVRKKKLGFRL